RLIDFGIARPTAGDETELTSDNMVVGTPGFLSPEQARAQQVGAASDVFSLGCVLAYAATGRLPFGTGAADALLYRTVHDEPELGGVADAELRALLGRCLAKEPEQRPTAAEVDAELVEDAPAGTVDWLPDPVVRMIAERSAEMLALPGIEPTKVSQESAGHSRRRVLALGGGAALLLAGGGAALWAAMRDDDPGTQTASSPWVIGLHADLTGPLRKTGRAQERGARLAVERFNARRGRPFSLALRTEDDRGEPARAVQAARRLTGAADVLAVLGPTGYSSAQAALEVYDGAGMPLLTVSELSTSAAQSAIAGTAPRSYFRAASLSAYGALATVTALGAAGVGTLGLLGDRAGRLAGMESVIVVGLQARGRLELYLRVVPALASTSALGPVTDDMLGRGVDGFYYIGTPERAAVVARTLAERNFTGPRYLDAASATDAFISGAGQAAEGWQVLTSYIGPDAAPVSAP
ncbi:serine/threonine-protein kinase, partial [Streptomyces umbrinus]